ncbi:MAG TPA: cAMP-activated global transcriptional regulator CRP [Oceanospirillales bacterium]|nr:cAMP-activated global transcriptional regulator CRP [Oceanospirillales bacterium]
MGNIFNDGPNSDELYIGERVHNTSFFKLDVEALNRFLSYCHRRKFPKKTTIIRPGDLANTLYYIVSGSVTISFENDDGKELILAYLNAGDFIGEMGLFMSTERREVMVKTKEGSELAEIGYQRLGQLFLAELKDDAAQILYYIGTQLTHRLLQTSRKVHRLAFLDVTGRVARTLLDFCKEPAAMTHPEGTQIKVSRQEIAKIVGCSREMAGRVLKDLELEGNLIVKGHTIVVLHDKLV